MAVLQVNNRHSQVTIDTSVISSVQKSSTSLGNPSLTVGTPVQVIKIPYEDYEERDKDFDFLSNEIVERPKRIEEERHLAALRDRRRPAPVSMATSTADFE